METISYETKAELFAFVVYFCVHTFLFVIEMF